MEIIAVKTVEPTNITTYPSVKSLDNVVQKKNEQENQLSSQQPAQDAKGKTELQKNELLNVNHQLNKFMTLINADIQFELHEKTKQLMVQVVDTKEHKVLKEFPSHEMLDVLANIRDYVGVLLDEKA